MKSIFPYILAFGGAFEKHSLQNLHVLTKMSPRLLWTMDFKNYIMKTRCIEGYLRNKNRRIRKWV